MSAPDDHRSTALLSFGAMWDEYLHAPDRFAARQLARVTAEGATMGDVVDVLQAMGATETDGGAPWATHAAIVAAIRVRTAGLSDMELLEQLGDPLTRHLLPVGCTWADVATAAYLPPNDRGPREHAAHHVAEYVAAWVDRTVFPDDGPAGAARVPSVYSPDHPFAGGV